MTKQQENNAFAKMLKEFPKVFGRVSFRERLMLRAAFDYVVEEIIVDLEKENAKLRNNGFTVSAMIEQQLKVAIEKGEQLEKENAELKSVERMALYSKLSDQLTKAKGLLTEMQIALRQTKDGAKYNVSLLEDVDKLLKEIEK